jgi:hypothetical protein
LRDNIQLEAGSRQLDSLVKAQDMTAENKKFRNARIEQHTTSRGFFHGSSLGEEH